MTAYDMYQMAESHFNAIYHGGLVRGRNIDGEEIAQYVYELYAYFGRPTYIDCDDGFRVKELDALRMIRSLQQMYQPIDRSGDTRPERLPDAAYAAYGTMTDANDYELLADYGME